MAFIARFSAYFGDAVEVATRVFTAGYCFYFAHMLQVAFNRGRVVFAAPLSHIIWEDDNGCAYDFYGIFYDYAFGIDLQNVLDIEGFKHVHAPFRY